MEKKKQKKKTRFIRHCIVTLCKKIVFGTGCLGALYWLAALQHILCIYSVFDGSCASLQHRPTSLCAVFLAPTKLRYRYTSSSAQPVNTEWGLCYNHIQKLAGFVYHLASTWLQLPLISTCWNSWSIGSEVTYSVHAIGSQVTFPSLYLQ